MARVNVYLPNDLQRLAMASDLNLSGLLRSAVQVALAERDACPHELVACTRCLVELPGPKVRKTG